MNNSATMYLPTDSNDEINSLAYVNYHPVTITVVYQASISDTIWNSGINFFVCQNSPSITFKVYNPDGSLYSPAPSLPSITGPGKSVSGTISLPPNTALAVKLSSGEQRKNFAGSPVEQQPYTCRVQLKYKWDDAPPTVPVIGYNGAAEQVKQIGAKIHTSHDGPPLNWSSEDRAASYLGYQYGPAGIKDYLVEWNALNQPVNQYWTIETERPFDEGEYQVKIKARDRENNESAFCSPVTLVVDRSVNQPTFPADPIQLTPNDDGTYHVTVMWNPVQDVSGVGYQVALSNSSTSPGAEIFSSTVNQYTFTGKTKSDIPLYAYVRAIDGVNNISDWAVSKEFRLFSPQTHFISPAPVALNQNNQPVYSVGFGIADVNASRYVISRQVPGKPDTRLELARISRDQLVQNNPYLDMGGLSSHLTYQYELHTENPIYPGVNCQDDFDDGDLNGWTVRATHGTQFTPQDKGVKITHSPVPEGLDYISYPFPMSGNTTMEFDAKIGSTNNDNWSLIIESDGGNGPGGLWLAFNKNTLHSYYDGGWHEVQTISFNQWHHFKIVSTGNLLQIYIDGSLKYSENRPLTPRSYISFRDYGLCGGTVTSFIDNVKITAPESAVSSASTYQIITIPNISAAGVEAAIYDHNGNLITGPYLKTNQLVFQINQSHDLEGDELRYQFCYNNLDTGACGFFPETLQSNPITIDSLDLPDGRYEVWLGYGEFADGVDWAIPNSGAPRPATPKQIIHIDTVPPLKPAVSVSPAGRTNQTQPVLSFNSSDITSGIHHYEISVDGQAFYEVTNPYTLPSQTGGVHTILAQAADNAGWFSEQTEVTLVIDTTPPEAPWIGPCDYPEGELGFHWYIVNNDRDLDLFYVKFNGDNEIPVTPTIDEGNPAICHGSFTVSTAGLGPNQPVTIRVSAKDQAGNYSSGDTLMTGYTPAALGTVEFQGAGYDLTLGRHQLKWKLTTVPGTAKSHRLEYGNLSFEGFSVLGALTPDAAGLLVHDSVNGAHLTPHGTYHYRLVACNNSDDPTYGAVFEQQVPNLPPGQPAPLAPQGFARSEVEFTYQPAVDYDGDNAGLTHRIYLSDSPYPGSYSELPGDTASGLIPGQTYYWYVQARDTYGGVTDSVISQFTVDTGAPTLNVAEPDRPYTRRTSLSLTAGDERSGVHRITYQKIATDTNAVLDEGEIVFTTDLTGTCAGTVALTEGSYHLHFTAWDRAGNTREVQLNNLWVDQTPPELSNLSHGLIMSGNRYLTGKLTIPASFTATDDFSGTSGLRYWLLKDRGESLDNGQWLPLSPALADHAYTLEISGASGQEYYLALAVEDRAGNRSLITYLGPVLIDLTPPRMSLTLEGLHRSGAGFYISALNGVTVNLTGGDPETGLNDLKLSLVDAAGTQIAPWSDWEALQSTGLSSGQAYRVTLRAINNAGAATQYFSETFIYDPTPPQATLTGPLGSLTAGEQACFNLGGADPESAVTGYRLGIVAFSNPEEILPIGGSDPDGWLTIKNNGNSVQVRVEMPAGAAGIYYPVAEFENGAGLKTILTGEFFTLENTREKVIVSDQGPYTMFTDRLTGWWLFAGARPVTDYRYRIITLANQIVQDWQTTTGTGVTITGLNLTGGVSYRFEVQARYSDGTYSESGFSPGIMVDGTPPELIRFNAPGYCSSANLKVEWAGQDPESGIQTVQAALGSGFHQTDLTGGWVTLTGSSAILSRDINGQPLSLLTGNRYYLTLRLTNGAGLVLEQTGSAITIDDTPPPLPVVMDQGAYLNTRQSLEANWRWSPVDPESGPESYQWALLEYGQEIESAVWRDANSSREITLADFQQQHGHTYYFAVRALNRAGLSSVGVSNGIMIDATAPFLPEVKLLNAVNLGDPNAAEVHYITNNQNLALWINSQDPESPVDNYLYAWGQPGTVEEKTRLESGAAGIHLDDPALTEGMLTIFAGECANQAQLVSGTGYSGGVVLDTGAPKIIDVHGGVSGETLFFDWNVESSVSPVAKYEVALAQLEDPGNLVWIDNGLERSCAINGQHLADGKYYLLIRATNQAGTSSRRQDDLDEWGTSPVVSLDRTPPVISEFTCDRYASNQLKFQLTSIDNLSGIGGYQYALGGRSNPLEYSGGWIDIDSAGEKLNYQIATAQIAHQSEVYLMVRVKDQTGIWSAVRTSPPVTIDHTPPVKPVVSGGSYTSSRQEITGINYTSTDLESGITHYRLGIVTEPGGEWLGVQLRPVSEFDSRLTGLDLTEGAVYYLAVQTQNSAGVWSETGYSDPVTVDTIAPQLEFSRTGSAIVINYPPLTVEYRLSEAASVDFTLTGVDGAAKQFTVSGQPGLNQWIFTESLPQTYHLSARAADPAGNSGAVAIQTIRVNAPPRITLVPEFNSTPGAPIRFQATVADPDGMEAELIYQWDPGDGNGVLTEKSPEYRYFGQIQDYPVTLTVTDPDGGVAVAMAMVKVRNTSRGTLYLDETWRGTHRISGAILVPAGVNLVIEPGTEVIVEGIPGETDPDLGLTVQGSLNAGPGVSFRSGNANPSGWRGIIVEGQASLTGVTIRDAQRGLAVLAPGQAMVTDCGFIGNYAGVHAYGSKPVIQNCLFQDNLWYGIKEDEGGRPVVIGCEFAGNGIDYYQDEMTRISVDELNEIEGNMGNW